jgi:hypothetical protein
MDPDSDPGSGSGFLPFDLQNASKKLIFNTIFSAYFFLKLHLHKTVGGTMDRWIETRNEDEASASRGFFSESFSVLDLNDGFQMAQKFILERAE